MKQNYPRMLYLGGVAAALSVIVRDEVDEDARRADGFLRLGDTPKAKAPKAPPAVVAPASIAVPAAAIASETPPSDPPPPAATVTTTVEAAPASPKRGRPPKADTAAKAKGGTPKAKAK